METKFRGACLCGAITFEVVGFSPQVANCHCSMCRKFHGAAYGTLVSVHGLHWLTGIDRLKDYLGVNGTIRSFCADCGSSIGFRARGTSSEQIELAVALFDDPIPIQVDAQIFTKYKANWVTLQDGLQTHAEGREATG